MKKNFLIWNPQKILPNGTEPEIKPENIIHLLFAEMLNGGAMSSTVEADDAQLQQMLDAVYNEADIHLASAVLNTGTRVTFHPHVKPEKHGKSVYGFKNRNIVFLDHSKALAAAKVWEDVYNLSTTLAQVEVLE